MKEVLNILGSSTFKGAFFCNSATFLLSTQNSSKAKKVIPFYGVVKSNKNTL